MNQTQLPATTDPEADAPVDPVSTPERSPIGTILKNLRGDRTLRQVHAAAGVPYTYLSSIELGQKNPGIKTLTRLADYYEVPLHELLEAAGTLRLLWNNPSGSSSNLEFTLQAFKDNNIRDMNVRRSYDFVLADPDLSGCRKPEETPPPDCQRFVVEMYEHYTGKKLL